VESRRRNPVVAVAYSEFRPRPLSCASAGLGQVANDFDLPETAGAGQADRAGHTKSAAMA